MSDRLFTPRFLVMCGFSFTVFVSVFQLLPTAPYHILDLGGTTAAAGLFLGALTYSSALSAPWTGPLADRIGHRRVLVGVSLVLAGFSVSYAFIRQYPVLLGVVFVHGLFWSALLTASGAYMTATIPVHRRAEGLGYWGLMSVTAIAVAPTLGFVVYHLGWKTLCGEIALLNLAMAAIAWRLPDDREVAVSGAIAGSTSRAMQEPALSERSESNEPALSERSESNEPALSERSESNGPALSERSESNGSHVQWNILLLSVCLGFVAFGYGGLTSFSALFADALHLAPRSLYLTIMAATMLVARLGLGPRLDRLGHRRVLLPCLALAALGLLALAGARGLAGFTVSAVAFGAGFGLMYPAFAAYVMVHVHPGRRGAAFGAIISAFDTGIGTGSTSLGWIVHHAGFRVAFVVSALLAALSLPYFLVAERRLGFRRHETTSGVVFRNS